jgi:hypothetical protein
MVSQSPFMRLQEKMHRTAETALSAAGKKPLKVERSAITRTIFDVARSESQSAHVASEGHVAATCVKAMVELSTFEMLMKTVAEIERRKLPVFDTFKTDPVTRLSGWALMRETLPAPCISTFEPLSFTADCSTREFAYKVTTPLGPALLAAVPLMLARSNWAPLER